MDILQFQDVKTVPDIVHNYTADLRHNSVPIVINNGSYQSRVGWSTQSEPILLFKNLIAKPRKERSKKDTTEIPPTPQLQVGNDIVNIEAVRFQLKTQFDRNVVTHFEAQEHLFDYTFTHLGIDTEKCVDHPIVLTEPFLNPNTSRNLMSELLFECYNIPGVAYGIDTLFAYKNTDQSKDALIVSIGYHTIHIIPVLDDKVVFEHSRRVNVGGFHVVSFLHRVLQLKYPGHANAITLSRAEELFRSVCEIAVDYREELTKWNDPEYYERSILKIQLPYTTNVGTSLTVEQQKERKRELARRLTEINARKREERLAEDEDKLQTYLELNELRYEDPDEFERSLQENNLKGTDELRKNIGLLHTRIEKTKQKIISSNMSDDIVIEEPPSKQSKSNKVVFESEKAMNLFVQNAKKMKQEILNKKTSRKQRKQDMAKRRTAAGQERMRIISQLARKEKGNDDFGMRDEDWDIYKTISRDGGDSDSETENEKLLELEEVIKTHEPHYEDDSSAPAEAHQLHIGIERYRAPELLFKPYMIGSPEAGLAETLGYVLSLFSPEEQFRLSGNVVLDGGVSNIPGLRDRLSAELLSIRPFRSEHAVRVLSTSPSLVSWQGARAFANSPDFINCLVTKADYLEYGGEFTRHGHFAANLYTQSPKEILLEIDV